MVASTSSHLDWVCVTTMPRIASLATGENQTKTNSNMLQHPAKYFYMQKELSRVVKKKSNSCNGWGHCSLTMGITQGISSSTRAVLNGKKKCSVTKFSQKRQRALYVFNHWFLALHVFTQGFRECILAVPPAMEHSGG